MPLRQVVRSVVGSAAVFVGAARLPAQAPSHPRAGEREELLTVTHAGIASKAFQATHDLSIWLPSDAAPGTRYPVLVFLDAEEKGQFRSALANVQFLIDRQLIPPIMVVGVPYHANRTHELTPAATGSSARDFPTAGGADRTMQFIADELLPWTDAHYPTLPLRLLAGHSFGGLFALYTMVTRPEVFRLVIAMSPGLQWNDGALVPELAAKIAADAQHSRTLFLTSGGLEPVIDRPTTAFAARLTTLLDSVHTGRLRFERREYPRDGHSMTPLPGLVDGLRMVFDPLLVPIDSVVNQLAAQHTQDTATIRAAVRELESRYAAGAATLGIPGPFPETPLDILGSYSLQSKQAGLALQLFRENLGHYPHSSNAHESVGEALLAVGDTAKGVEELQAAIAMATQRVQHGGPILVLAQERAVSAAAVAALHAAHREEARAASR